MSQPTSDSRPTAAQRTERVQQAAAYLREVLDRPGPYRELWMVPAGRDIAELNQSAIAQVLVEHLWDAGDAENKDRRALRSKVSRALNGTVLTAKVLTLFIDAFHMSEEDAGRLRGLLAGNGTIKLLDRRFAVPVMERYLPNHETISLSEFHYLGPDGLPDRHRTVHSIRATQPMERYPYVFDTNATTIQVTQGGTPGPIYQIGEGLYAVDITLTEPLTAGETASLEYLATFRYPEPPPREFRRGVRRVAHNLTLRVQFDPAQLPAHIWLATWPSLNTPAVLGDEVWLDAEYSSHKFYESVENQLVGFVWDWE